MAGGAGVLEEEQWAGPRSCGVGPERIVQGDRQNQEQRLARLRFRAAEA